MTTIVPPRSTETTGSTDTNLTTREGLVVGLRERVAGRPMPGYFYTARAVFDADLDLIFGKQWFFATTEAEVPEAGDYATIEIGTRSIIVIRGDDEIVRAFHNVCRHRGARVLTEPAGFVGNLVCSYHSWTYGTDGALRHAPNLPENEDPSCLGLRKVAIRVIAGLVFLCLAADPPNDIDDFAQRLTPYLAPHKLGSTKVASQVDIIESGNWKLVMENNRECYHCDGHPELSASFFPTYGLATEDVPDSLRAAHDKFLLAETDLQVRCDELGLPKTVQEDLVGPNVAYRFGREALDGAGESFSLSGRVLVTKPLADLGETRLGRLTIHAQPNMWVHVMSDHAVVFTALPLAPDRTLVRTTWLVNADAVEGTHYQLDDLTYVWTETNTQDSVFVARTQSGVTDPAYLPGPYTAAEYQVDNFLSWYVDRMIEGCGASTRASQATA